MCIVRKINIELLGFEISYWYFDVMQDIFSTFLELTFYCKLDGSSSESMSNLLIVCEKSNE